MKTFEISIKADSLKIARAHLISFGLFITVRCPRLEGDEYIFKVVV